MTGSRRFGSHMPLALSNYSIFFHKYFSIINCWDWIFNWLLITFPPVAGEDSSPERPLDSRLQVFSWNLYCTTKSSSCLEYLSNSMSCLVLRNLGKIHHMNMGTECKDCYQRLISWRACYQEQMKTIFPTRDAHHIICFHKARQNWQMIFTDFSSVRSSPEWISCATLSGFSQWSLTSWNFSSFLPEFRSAFSISRNISSRWMGLVSCTGWRQWIHTF